MKLLFSLFLIFSLLLYSYKFQDDLQIENYQDEEDQEIEEIYEEKEKKFKEQQIEEMRNNALSCVLLTKSNLQRERVLIREVIDKVEKKKELIRKIEADILLGCYNRMRNREAMQILKESEQQYVDSGKYKQYLNVDIKSYGSDSRTELSEMQEQLMEFSKNVEKQMRKQQMDDNYDGEYYEDEEVDQFQAHYAAQSQEEVMIAGFSVKALSPSHQILCLILLLSLILLIIFFLFSQLTKPQYKHIKKKNKNKY